jgi:hypothetical protein
MALKMHLQEVFKIVGFSPYVMPSRKSYRKTILHVSGRFEHGAFLQAQDGTQII